MTDLRAGRADASDDRRLQRFISPDLLIIDDLARESLLGRSQRR